MSSRGLQERIRRLANTQMQTNWNTPVSFSPGADFSETTADFLGDFGFVPNNPGTWAMTTVPEPSTVVLPESAWYSLGCYVRDERQQSSPDACYRQSRGASVHA